MSSQEEQQTAIFRLYLNRYPVFGEIGPLLEQPEFDLATIKMTFEENQIRSISRSMLRADRKLLLKETTLPTIEQTVKELEQADLMQDITGIRVGYSMTYKIATSRYALFEPAWFVKRDGEWSTVDQAIGNEG